MMTPNSRSCHAICWGEGFTSTKFCSCAPTLRQPQMVMQTSSKSEAQRRDMSEPQPSEAECEYRAEGSVTPRESRLADFDNGRHTYISIHCVSGRPRQ